MAANPAYEVFYPPQLLMLVIPVILLDMVAMTIYGLGGAMLENLQEAGIETYTALAELSLDKEMLQDVIKRKR